MTLLDVAYHAGVSRATASLVLRNSPLVADTTRQRVQASIQQLGVMLGLQARGLMPGQDFAVIGFDDIAEAVLWHPPLTTVSLTPHQIGTMAAQRMLERIARPDDPPQRMILPPNLVIRCSCGTHNSSS